MGVGAEVVLVIMLGTSVSITTVIGVGEVVSTVLVVPPFVTAVEGCVNLFFH